MADDTQTAAKTYEGGCHCGAVRYRVELDLSQPVVACNCSMCGRSGTLLSFVPADKFELLSGADAVSDYQFNTHKIHHKFCSTCGIKSFAEGADAKGNKTAAINARCLDGVDPETLPVHRYDGKSA